MVLTYEILKEELDTVISEFNRTLLNSDYTKAKQITGDLLALFRKTYGIELDRKPEFDHDFQEAMKIMDESLTRIHPNPANTDEYLDVHEAFEKVVDQVMHVNEVRRRAMELEPNAELFISSYTKGIEEANAIKKQIKDSKKSFDEIENEVLKYNGTRLDSEISLNKYIVGRSKIIIDKIAYIEQLRDANRKMNADIASGKFTHEMLDGHISANKREIDEGINIIKEFLDELKKNGIDTSKFDDLLELDPVRRNIAIRELESLRTDHESQMISNYSIIVRNLNAAKTKYFDLDLFRLMDFSKFDSTTEDGRNAIDSAIAEIINNKARLDNLDKLQDNRIKIFTDSINQVKEEQKIIDTDTSDVRRLQDSMPSDVKAKMDAEKAWYKQDAIDKMYGSSDKAEKWKKYFKLLKAAEKEVDFEYLDETGARKTGKYKTVDYDKLKADLASLSTPVSIEEALKLLQLEEYKERLERITKFKAGDKSVFKELPSYSKLESATTDEERNNALAKLKQELEEDMIYVATNHGSFNNFDIEAKAIGNAGVLTKTGNVSELLGIVPLSSAKSLRGKALLLGLDALAIIAIPISVPTKILYKYTPVIGKNAQMKRYIKKHDGEHSSPYEGRANARKMLRRAEYKQQMGGIFKGARAWMRATADDLWNDSRRKQTEDAVIDRECNERIFPSVEARYINGAMITEREKQNEARENMQKRVENVREIARRDYVYNDLIADSKEAKTTELNKQVILGAALEQNGEDAELLRYSKTVMPRDRRFKGIKGAIGAVKSDLIADKINYDNPEGSVVQTDPIEQRKREEGIIAEKTAHNYVPYLLTGFAVGGLYRAASHFISGQTSYTTEGRNIHDIIDVREYTKYKNEDVLRPVTKPDYHSVPRTAADFEKANNGKSGVMYYSVSGGEKGPVPINYTNYDHVKGFYVEFTDKAGKTQSIGFSSSENGGVFRYLSEHADKYGLDQATISKYVDPKTGMLRKNADLYDLTAKIANKTGKGNGITGDDIIKQVYSGKGKAYIEPVDIVGSRHGGWIDVKSIVKELKEITYEEVVGTKRVENGIGYQPIRGYRYLPPMTITRGNPTMQFIKEALKKGSTAALAAFLGNTTGRAVVGDKSDLKDVRGDKNSVRPSRYEKDERDGR